MKRIIPAGLCLLVAAVVAWPQTPPLRIFTRPVTPNKETLSRLQMSLAWKTRLHLDGMRDALASVQIIPGESGPQIVAQSNAGVVFLLDGETGDLLWRTPVGVAYWDSMPVAYTPKDILTTRRNFLFALNRTTGKQRLYTLNPDSKLPEYGYELLSGPSSAPVAFGGILYVTMINRVATYAIPNFEAAEIAAKREDGAELKRNAPQPVLQWAWREDDINIEQSPLVYGNQISVATTNGHLLSLNRFELSATLGITEERVRFDYQAQGGIAAPMGQHGPIAYVPSQDYSLYAVSMANQRLVWRFLSGSPILVKPAVTDEEVFVTSQRQGMYKLDRAKGRQQWLNPDAYRYLASNGKFLYAADKQGYLLVLDQKRGNTLARYDARDWQVPLTNELTDRLYLANHDGQILCLRHRDFETPLTIKTLEGPAEPKKVDDPKKEPEKKDPEMKEPEKKDPEKKDPEKKEPEKKEVEKKDEKKDAARSSGRGPLLAHHLPRGYPSLSASEGHRLPFAGAQARKNSQPSRGACQTQSSPALHLGTC